jgi:cyanophycinase
LSRLPNCTRWLVIHLALCALSGSQTCRGEGDAVAIIADAGGTGTTAPLPKGHLLLMGGAERDDNHLLWSELVRLAGGQGARIAVFTTASTNPERSAAAISEHLRELGLDPFVVPVSAVLPQADRGGTFESSPWVERVRAANAVFLGAGAQAKYRQELIDPQGKGTSLLEAIRHVYQRGGLVAGTSAGAAVMSRVMYVEADFVLPVLLNGARKGTELDDGFGLVPSDWFIDQHCLVRGRFARALVAMQSCQLPFGLGIDEDSGVVVEAGRTARVIGYRGAVVLDLSSAVRKPEVDGFNLQKARLSFLSHGDRIDLATREIKVAAEKPADDKIDPAQPGFKPYYEHRLFFNDILANTTLVDLMYKLVDGPHDEAIGLAFDGIAARRGDTPGFEFKFYRGRDTVSWDSRHARGDPHTVQNVYLDIRPIVVRGPLYDSR